MPKPHRPANARDKNILTIPERAGELVGIVVVILVAAFFAYHLLNNTGFMTSSFGMAGTVLLFGSAGMSVVASGARAAIGRRDKSRPFELASGFYWAIASLWFLSVFPFDFTHLSDPLPAFLRFFVSWISNEIGWVIILLTVLGSIGTAVYAAVRLFLDRLPGSFC